jgi:D-alanyl-D-alanine carboxypeptidase
MKSTPRPAANADWNQRHGLGIEKLPTECGTVFGHSGGFPGYLNYALSSGNGMQQAVLMANIEPTALGQAGMSAFTKALFSGYCSTQ